MARKNKNTCRICGDVSATNESTWQPTGLCAAHSAPEVKAARKARSKAYREEKHGVVVDTPEPEASGNRCIQTYRGEVWVNSDGEPL